MPYTKCVYFKYPGKIFADNESDECFSDVQFECNDSDDDLLPTCYVIFCFHVALFAHTVPGQRQLWQ